MRRILFLTLSAALSFGCAAEFVGPDYQEEEYDLQTESDPGDNAEDNGAPGVQWDPVLSPADGDHEGPSPYPWMIRNSDPGGPTPYPWDTDTESSGSTNGGSSGSSESQGSEPNPSGGDTKKQTPSG